jgi:hypothetical protein
LAWRAVQTPQGICQDKAGKEYVLKFD